MSKVFIASIITVLMFIIFQPNLAFAQPEVIGEGYILNSYMDWKNIPIHEYLDTLYVVLVEYSIDCYIGIPPHGWGQIYDIPTWPPHRTEFILNNSGRQFYYNSSENEFLYWEPEPHEYWIFRDCPGRPVMDSQNNCHVIWEGEADTLFYGFSRDTLSSFETVDTLVSMPPLLRLVTSPDNHLIGAVLYDTEVDSLNKYLALAGGPLDFSNPSQVIFFNPEDIGCFYDIVLGRHGQIYLELNKDYGQSPWGWGMHYFWSETSGFIFLRPSYDDVFDGTSFQICFGSNEDEILLIDSGTYMGYGSKFYYSPDGGNTWYLSSFVVDPAYHGSAARVFSDTIDFVFSDYSLSYYFPIPRDSIIENLTDVVRESESIPLQILLLSYPNPFNSSTTISFTLPEAGHVSLAVYDIAGRLVNTLVDADVDAGRHTVIWDGADRSGRAVSSGIYFCALRLGEISSSRRMLLLR